MDKDTRELLEAADTGLGCLDGCFMFFWRLSFWLLGLVFLVVVFAVIVSTCGG